MGDAHGLKHAEAVLHHAEAALASHAGRGAIPDGVNGHMRIDTAGVNGEAPRAGSTYNAEGGPLGDPSNTEGGPLAANTGGGPMGPTPNTGGGGLGANTGGGLMGDIPNTGGEGMGPNTGGGPIPAPRALALRLAALVHDADDKKFFSLQHATKLTNARRIAVEAGAARLGPNGLPGESPPPLSTRIHI